MGYVIGLNSVPGASRAEPFSPGGARFSRAAKQDRLPEGECAATIFCLQSANRPIENRPTPVPARSSSRHDPASRCESCVPVRRAPARPVTVPSLFSSASAAWSSSPTNRPSPFPRFLSFVA